MSQNKMTAIEWLIDQMFKQGYFDGKKPLSFTNLDHLQHQAKEMEKQQIIDALTYGNKSELMASQKMFAEQYYNETYESDEHIVDANEMISDEEMDKAAINFCIKNIDEEVMHWHDIFVSGAKWYREQLKSRQ